MVGRDAEAGVSERGERGTGAPAPLTDVNRHGTGRRPGRGFVD